MLEPQPRKDSPMQHPKESINLFAFLHAAAHYKMPAALLYAIFHYYSFKFAAKAALHRIIIRSKS